MRIELSSLKSEHDFYSSALRDSPETVGISLQQDHLMSVKTQLQNSLTSLRAQKIFLVETNEKTRQQQVEGKKTLKASRWKHSDQCSIEAGTSRVVQSTFVCVSMEELVDGWLS